MPYCVTKQVLFTKKNMKHITTDIAEDSESDFVDIEEMKSKRREKVQEGNETTKVPSIHVNNVPMMNSQLKANVQRSETTRSSMKKSPLLQQDEEIIRKRAISFDLHDPRPSVSIQSPNEEPLRNLFSTSRWSASSSDSSISKAESTKLVENQPETDKLSPLRTEKQATEETKSYQTASQRSKSLGTRRQRSIDLVQKRNHSASDGEIRKQVVMLRDSAIDLISDEENSEAYAAVSLAGTLSRNVQPVRNKGIKRKYVIIGAVSGSFVAITIIVVLIVLLVTKI